LCNIFVVSKSTTQEHHYKEEIHNREKSEEKWKWGRSVKWRAKEEEEKKARRKINKNPSIALPTWEVRDTLLIYLGRQKFPNFFFLMKGIYDRFQINETLTLHSSTIHHQNHKRIKLTAKQPPLSNN
jgi:hypothetical protein